MRTGKIKSNQIRGFRRIYTSAILQDNQQFQIDVPRGAAIESAIIELVGSANITAAFTSVRSAGAAKYLRRVDWVANGNITLDSVSGYGAFLCAQYIRKAQIPITNPTVGIGTPAFRACIPLDRVFSDHARPKDSLLKTDENMTSLQLRVQVGALSDMFVVGTGAANYSGQTVTINVWVQDYQETPDANGRTPIPLYYRKTTEQLLQFTGSGSSIPFRINTGNRLRGVLLVPQDNTNSEPSVALVTRARIIRSGDTRFDLAQFDLQALGVLAYDLNAADSSLQSTVWIDFANPDARQGNVKYSEFWPVPSNADVQLQLDVSAAGSCRMIMVEGVDLWAS
jgi:hypothetical protein